VSQEPNPQAEQLVKEAVESLKAGDRAVARGKLEAAVKIDPYSERAWLALASVVETVEEKRTCLGNVILINPQNKRAQEMLEKLEGRKPQESVLVPGKGSPKKGSTNILFLVGIGVGVLLILVAAILVLSAGGGGDEVTIPTIIPTSTIVPTLSADDQTATAAAPTNTPTSTQTPTITPTFLATWTPTTQATHTATPVPLPALPTGLLGRIIMQSGRSIVDPNNQPIQVYNTGDGTKVLVSTGEQRGQKPALVPGQSRFAWQIYSSGTRTLILQIQSFGVPQTVNVASLYDNDPFLSELGYPTWYNNNLVFAATYPGSLGSDLWLIPVSAAVLPTPEPTFGLDNQPTVAVPTQDPFLVTVTPDPNLPTPSPLPTSVTGPIGNSGLVRLTADDALKTWSSFDPTGTALVFVMEKDGVTDLRVVNVNSQRVFVLTDNGNTLVESAPDWSINNEIVFSAMQSGSNLSDIYLMSADGSAAPTVLFDFGPHDIQPRFSPDGRYIVFSSDKNGNWDVFVYDRQDETFYLIEGNPDTTDIANDWTP
jgi:Tol biopolymer transport system component